MRGSIKVECIHYVGIRKFVIDHFRPKLRPAWGSYYYNGVGINGAYPRYDIICVCYDLAPGNAVGFIAYFIDYVSPVLVCGRHGRPERPRVNDTAVRVAGCKDVPVYERVNAPVFAHLHDVIYLLCKSARVGYIPVWFRIHSYPEQVYADGISQVIER
jgi:hypothetical protein